MSTGRTAKAPGHTPTLIASFLHFDLSFMLWVMFGALGNYIADEAGLSSFQKAFVVAVPILTGSLLRIPLGILGDRIGGRRVGITMLAFLFLPLTLAWQFGASMPALIPIGLMLGTAGASFAVALPLASKWYPAERQGLVMGIAAAGNSGTVIANLAAPRLAGLVGWHNVLGLAMIPLLVVLVAFTLMTKDKPGAQVKTPVRSYASLVKQSDLWWFCLIYSVTFGGYVGLGSFLPIFFRDQYQVSKVEAGYLTALAAFTGSAIRPLGGYLADRLGGTRMLAVLLVAIGALYMLCAGLPTLWMMVSIIVVLMACLGLGNGATFQAVPQRFRQQIGVATGIVGAIGGVGGFLLPITLGSLKSTTGSFGLGYVALAGLALGSALLLRVLLVARQDWKAQWRSAPRTVPEGNS